MGDCIKVASTMKQFSATHAKQHFGDLLTAAGLGPVVIERHGKVQAIIAAPHFFGPPSAPDALAAKGLARLRQSVIEKDRLIRHQRIALDLVTATEPVFLQKVAMARATVQRWRQEGLCSADYIDRWSTILELPAAEMALRMTDDNKNDWGPALRQNSPWVGLQV